MKTVKSIIVKPIITEKSSIKMADGKYVFAVLPNVNKVEIKKEIEEVFGVKVKDVNTANFSGKTKRVGKNLGKKASWKKAVISLVAGEKISNFEQIL
jgi:large subunit ribosomal protein L23